MRGTGVEPANTFVTCPHPCAFDLLATLAYLIINGAKNRLHTSKVVRALLIGLLRPTLVSLTPD